jgi:hypothetical protein
LLPGYGWEIRGLPEGYLSLIRPLFSSPYLAAQPSDHPLSGRSFYRSQLLQEDDPSPTPPLGIDRQESFGKTTSKRIKLDISGGTSDKIKGTNPDGEAGGKPAGDGAQKEGQPKENPEGPEMEKEMEPPEDDKEATTPKGIGERDPIGTVMEKEPTDNDDKEKSGATPDGTRGRERPKDNPVETKMEEEPSKEEEDSMEGRRKEKVRLKRRERKRKQATKRRPRPGQATPSEYDSAAVSASEAGTEPTAEADEAPESAQVSPHGAEPQSKTRPLTASPRLDVESSDGREIAVTAHPPTGASREVSEKEEKPPTARNPAEEGAEGMPDTPPEPEAMQLRERRWDGTVVPPKVKDPRFFRMGGGPL